MTLRRSTSVNDMQRNRRSFPLNLFRTVLENILKKRTVLENILEKRTVLENILKTYCTKKYIEKTYCTRKYIENVAYSCHGSLWTNG